jgi:radical SAM/Cys-rich protein
MAQSLPLSLLDDSSPDPFAARLAAAGQRLARAELTTLQLNLGKMCNLACGHCHVEAGPKRTEIMTWTTMEHILRWLDRYAAQLNLKTVDLTGGAPEMNPLFRRLVTNLHQRGLHIIDRCNLTILLEPQRQDLAQFLADHEVEISASLPCYLEDNVDKQRGRGVFHDSIIALQKLNALGYGQTNSPLRLDLVFNPVDYSLPPDQETLENQYRIYLHKHYNLVFNKLWTITNMPIKRFEHALRRDGQYENYMSNLRDAHHDSNVESVMCRSLVSVGWQGSVYDCDFNQMLNMPLAPTPSDADIDQSDEHIVEATSGKLWEFTPRELLGRSIRTGAHCFGCTAGGGSSCTGALS